MLDSRTVIPRDDRAWPRWALPFSLVVVIAAIAIGIGIAVGAAGRGSSIVAIALGGFAIACAFEMAVFVVAARSWIAGRPVPRWSNLLQVAGVGVCVAVLYGFDYSVGGAMMAGLFGGMTLANALTIRAARKNRTLVDEAESAYSASLAASREGTHSPHDDQREYTTMAPVGQVLRAIIGLERQRALGWLISGAVVIAVSLMVEAPEPVTVIVLFGAVMAVLAVVRQLWGTWLAHRDYMKAATPPRRAFVVLMHDPAPRMIRPLLGIWSQPPLVRSGRMPTPERVYRCDDEFDALECFHHGVVVHEAWVDTGLRTRSKPRWVAADAGIVLPHRRSLFGRWYMSSLVGGSWPRAYERLTLHPPHPSTESAVEGVAARSGLLAAVGWRVLGLLALGLLTYWSI